MQSLEVVRKGPLKIRISGGYACMGDVEVLAFAAGMTKETILIAENLSKGDLEVEIPKMYVHLSLSGIIQPLPGKSNIRVNVEITNGDEVIAKKYSDEELIVIIDIKEE